MILRDLQTGEVLELTPRMVAWLQVAAGVDEVGQDDHTDQQRHTSRAAMFKHVDRQIRARVASLMPEVLRAAQQQIDNDLGVEKITEAVREHRRRCSEQLCKQRESFDATICGLVADALASIEDRHIDELAKRVKRAIGSVVAKEVTRQLGRLLAIKAPPAPARKGKPR